MKNQLVPVLAAKALVLLLAIFGGVALTFFPDHFAAFCRGFLP